MNYQITINFEIKADPSDLTTIRQLLEAAIDNHCNVQSIVEFTAEEN